MLIWMIKLFFVFGAVTTAAAEPLAKFLEANFISKDGICKVNGCFANSPWNKITPICVKMKFSKDQLLSKISRLKEPLFFMAESLCDVKSAGCYEVIAVEVTIKNCLKAPTQRQQRLQPSIKQSRRQNMDVECLMKNRPRCTGLHIWEGTCPCLIYDPRPRPKSYEDYYSSDYYPSDYSSYDDRPHRTTHNHRRTTTRHHRRTTTSKHRRTTTTTPTSRKRTTSHTKKTPIPEPPSSDSDIDPTPPEHRTTNRRTTSQTKRTPAPEPPSTDSDTDSTLPDHRTTNTRRTTSLTKRTTFPEPPTSDFDIDPTLPDTTTTTSQASRTTTSQTSGTTTTQTRRTTTSQTSSRISTTGTKSTLLPGPPAYDYSSDYDITPYAENTVPPRKEKKGQFPKETLVKTCNSRAVWQGCILKERNVINELQQQNLKIHKVKGSLGKANNIGCPLTSKTENKTARAIRKGPLRILKKKLEQQQRRQQGK